MGDKHDKHDEDQAGMSWSETKALLAADYDRLLAIAHQHHRSTRFLRWSPSYIAVYLFRLSHHMYQNQRPLAARLIWHLNQLLTGADISEPAEIGPGFVLLHPMGAAVMCHAGKNLTISACAGIGGEIGRDEDIGAGPGLAVIGDDVSIGAHGGILGPVSIGDRVEIRSGAVVSKSIPDESVVEGRGMVVIQRRQTDEL